MTNPTDTNQASEKLRKSVEQCFIKNNMCDCGGEHNALNIDETEYFDVESVVNDVISLIHTEKLKLLDRLHHEYYEVDEETLDTLIEAERNKLKEVK